MTKHKKNRCFTSGIICLLLLFGILGSMRLAAQQKATNRITLNGFVKDSLTGETLIGASLSVDNTAKGVTTNSYGFFSLSLSEGRHYLLVSFVGYKTKAYELLLDSSYTLDVALIPNDFEAAETVVVTGQRRDKNVQSAQMGARELGMERIKQVPARLGEVDVLRALQLLPGISNAGEGNSGIYVRGGGPDQNLIILDDAVVYNPGHLFGFFSVFNGDAIKNVSLIKGGMPAQYGGRLSSVVDITMKDGNNQQFEGEGGIGTIASRIAVQGPIEKDKSSFLVAARRTYIDALVKPFVPRTAALYGSGYYFYDVNTKINFRLSEKDRIFLSGYFGRDVFDFRNSERAFNTSIPWGNSTATARWNHVFSRKMFANTTVVFNDYRFRFDATQNDLRFVLSSGIRDWNAKVDFDYYPAPEHWIKYGAQYTNHTFLPNQVSGSQGETVFSPNNALEKYAHEYAFYLQDEWEVSPKLKINAGLRYSSFTQIGPYTSYVLDDDGNRTDSTLYDRGERVKNYGGLEPRFTMRYSFNNSTSFKAAITRNLQYIHLATNSGTTLPTDLWVPSTEIVRPQDGYQYAVGFFKNFKNNQYEASVELYYKTMENQIEYREGYTPSLIDPELEFVFGKGWSYGAEFFVNKSRGKLTGWIGYTLSYTWRQFDNLNNGNKFPAKYDRRHDLSIVAAYDLNKKWKLGGTIVYATGNATTFPEQFYFIEGVLTQQNSDLNSYRLPAYHRMDLSATYTPNPDSKKKLKSSWVFSIYNVYSRLNPYFIYFDQEGSPAQGNQTITTLQVSLFPILPSVTWNFKF